MRSIQALGRLGAILAVLAGGIVFTGPPARGDISLYLGGTPAPDFAEYRESEPLPVLGVHSDDTSAWYGQVISSDFDLVNGQINDALFPSGGAVINPCTSPFGTGYEMLTYGAPQPGVQFMMDMDHAGEYGSLITLWNAATAFEVPVDTLCVWRGGWPGFEWGETAAHAGGPYQLVEGGSVSFDGTGSTTTL